MLLSVGINPIAAQVVPTAEIRGRVVSRTQVPLPGAEIAVLRDSLSVGTDSGGRFVLQGIPPGEHVIRIRRIGFLPQYFAATLAAGERKDVLITLSPGAYQLPEVEVTERALKPIEYAWTTKYDDFFRRKAVGLGYYISRKDIDQKSASETTELLLGVPGLQVRLVGSPGLSPNEVSSTRCRDMISVWIDGWELRPDPGLRRQSLRVGSMLERIHPLQIEMIEVYTGPARGQAEFVGSSYCAIMIWTR
ncbi:MAG: carboxypeptidase regulatory-like domain-containing protein [Gemmatimonadales bacterium]